MQAVNDQNLSWDEAFVNLIEADITQFGGNLNCLEIIECGKKLRETNALPINFLVQDKEEKGYAYKLGAAKTLLHLFPVLLVKKGYQLVVVNIHEMYVDAKFFENILNIDIHDIKEPPSNVRNQHNENVLNRETPDQNKSKSGPKPGSGGRPKKKHEQFPTVVQHAVDFLKMHAFSAEIRRRNDISLSMGVSMPELRAHLLKVIPDLQKSGLSLSTTKRLLVAPNQHMLSAKYYKGLLAAKVPSKCNNAVKYVHKDLHFIRAQVAFVRELAESYHSECISFSCDDKNQVNVGTLAVSRYHQISHFFPPDDAPNYFDHDFPYANSKIIPSGYLHLINKAKPARQRSRSLERNSCNKKMETRRSVSVESGIINIQRQNERLTDDNYDCNVDKLGRVHICYSRTGHLYVVNRASKFHSSSSESHANDLHFILQNPDVRQNKNCLFLLTDGGPDWTAKSLLTLMSHGRLWEDLNLDYLGIFNHAPGHSAENPIEHKWSPLSKWLVSVTLPITLEGDSKPPWEQTNLKSGEKEAKTAQVFDNAISTLCKYWNKSHDDFPVTPIPYPCNKKPYPYNDHAEVCSLFKKGIREILSDNKLKVLREKLMFLLKHCTRRLYSLEFLKCTDKTCTHCVAHPVQSPGMVAFLRKAGGYSPTPKLSLIHDGHFMTFLEIKFNMDHGMDIQGIGLTPNGVCNRKCRYAFTSKSDEQKHDLLVHYKERQTERQQDRRKRKADVDEEHTWLCKFVATDGVSCNFQSKTYYQLRKHKKNLQHFTQKKKKE